MRPNTRKVSRGLRGEIAQIGITSQSCSTSNSRNCRLRAGARRQARARPQARAKRSLCRSALAGWAEQSIFIKELDGGLEALASVLPIKGHTVRLINHRDTVKKIPLANFPNFAAAVHAIGNIMDRGNDVLIMLMTSHGYRRPALRLQLPGDQGVELTPQQVAADARRRGHQESRSDRFGLLIRESFVPPLANDNTIVLTAADAAAHVLRLRSRARLDVFRRCLLPSQPASRAPDFESAFNHARILIHGWETMDHATPSNPQGSFGRALVASSHRFLRRKTRIPDRMRNWLHV